MTEVPDKTPTPCCLCGNPIWPQSNGWMGGHNAAPLADGRCCDECNRKVLYARFTGFPDPPSKEKE